MELGREAGIWVKISSVFSNDEIVVVVVTLFYIDLFLQKYCFSSQLYTYVQAN